MIGGVSWGSVPDWVAGVGAAAGLGFAGWEIRRSREQREQADRAAAKAEADRREAMARSVGVRVEVGECDPPDGVRWVVNYKVVNGGQHPISAAVLVVRDTGTDDTDMAIQQGCALELVLGTVLPGETLTGGPYEVDFVSDPVFGELTQLGGLIFTDVWGQTWFSQGTELERSDYQARIC